MPTKEAGSSQAAWALLTEGVTAARVEAHRLRAVMSRVLQLVDTSEAKEHLYQVAGDLILSAPARMEVLEKHLDRTSYALSVLGEESLREMLPLHDRKIVDEAVERAQPLVGPGRSRSPAARVAERYIQRQADLSPPLGYPGGPCHVIERVEKSVRNPRLREEIIDDVEVGESLSNPEAAQVYDVEMEAGPQGTRIKRLQIGPHAQYRMDLRGVTVPLIRAALVDFFKEYSVEKSRGSYLAKKWEEDFARTEPINWTSRRLGLTVIFVVAGTDARIVTTYWAGESNPRPPGEGGCAT